MDRDIRSIRPPALIPCRAQPEVGNLLFRQSLDRSSLHAGVRCLSIDAIDTSMSAKAKAIGVITASFGRERPAALLSTATGLKVPYNVSCLCPHSLQANLTRT